MIELSKVSKVYKSKKGIATKALKEVSVKFADKGLVLVIMCLLLTNIGISSIVELFNGAISTFVSNDIKFLVYGNEQRIWLVVLTITIIVVANLLPIRKITKMKPVDVILDK